MEKKTTITSTINGDSDSLGVCQKLFTVLRRISFRTRGPTPAATRQSYLTERTVEIQNGAPTGKNGVVLVRDEPKPKKNDEEEIPSQRKLVLIEGPTNGHSKKSPDNHRHHHHHDHDHLNNTFEEFINRVRSKTEASPDVDHGGGEENMMTSGADRGIKKKGSFQDHVSDYIHRTKFKTTSHPSASAGSSSSSATTTTTTGKSVSYKTEY
ncbi:hypothetical protein PanWU01x14_114950 [Parasponia andersonii]|uniref:Uncharacterized protein n=1 Tax=Parasponia andersonii TaxID=3476 RepID=A0A2P5CXG9_PARAD|nr:hypothetical protein PanWU01x14_114950 [Parasponia andersonii]